MSRMYDDTIKDFIRERVARDIREARISGGVVTRFPPEPNGYLHIGHAKSICLNFGIAEEFGGITYLRFDDTNPLSESESYVLAIQRDVKWLGFDWESRLTFASDYFPQLYEFAEELIKRDKAFVCDLSIEALQQSRGSLIEPGTESPFRNRTIEENLDLFRRMRGREFPTGSKTLRAKIDMNAPNINMRDPVLYRIIHAPHHRTDSNWCIYPMYDFTHCICDALEGVSHSLCTLEFADHRPLYDWVLENININFHPPQIEFSRLGLEYNVMSKRMLNQLVENRYVSGWDDPRMPTLSGLRKRGVPPAAIRDFCNRVGVTKQNNNIETELLDFCIRNTLERTTRRAMAVKQPLAIEITNFEGDDLVLEAPWHPKNEELGVRTFTFGRTIYIERDDFAMSPPPKFKRLVLGGLVRLRYAFIIECLDVERDERGAVSKIFAKYFPSSKSGSDTSGLKPKGVIQFVAANNAFNAEMHDYDRLFNIPTPRGEQFEQEINPDSHVVHHGFVEKAVCTVSNCSSFQFERLGFYFRNPDESVKQEHLVFHRTVPLSQGWKPKL